MSWSLLSLVVHFTVFLHWICLLSSWNVHMSRIRHMQRKQSSLCTVPFLLMRGFRGSGSVRTKSCSSLEWLYPLGNWIVSGSHVASPHAFRDSPKGTIDALHHHLAHMATRAADWKHEARSEVDVARSLFLEKKASVGVEHAPAYILLKMDDM